ncbi:MAG: anti-sigma factor antagonist [Bacillota bacterium]|nr:anti-sigma factor antagonist [Bacillota bacterium]
MLQIQHEVLDNTLLVSVAGELDLETAPRLRTLVDSELAQSGARNLLLDLAGVSFLDSSGLGAILGRYRTVAAAGGRMGIAGARTGVKRILRLSGVAQIVSLFNTRETGLRSMARARRGRSAKRSRQAAVPGVIGRAR